MNSLFEFSIVITFSDVVFWKWSIKYSAKNSNSVLSLLWILDTGTLIKDNASE